jgi:hypothetical protein
MLQPKWPSSGVQIVAFQDSAAHCDAVFFLLLLFWLCGLHVVVFDFVRFTSCGCHEVFLLGRKFCCVLVGHHSPSLWVLEMYGLPGFVAQHSCQMLRIPTEIDFNPFC